MVVAHSDLKSNSPNEKTMESPKRKASTNTGDADIVEIYADAKCQKSSSLIMGSSIQLD